MVFATSKDVFEQSGWRFESESGPILNAHERKTLTEQLAATSKLEVPALPEAIFGHNRLTLTHEASGQTFQFDVNGALSSWVKHSNANGSGGLRVTSASLPSWKQVYAEQATVSAAINYDWTFSTDYCGTTTDHRESVKMVNSASQDATQTETTSFIESSFCTKVEYEAWLRSATRTGTGTGTAEEEAAPRSPWRAHEGNGLDMAMLRRRDVPILHFVDLTLYEDDLGDNGDSRLRLRLRVMPRCFLVLLRHALRVDGVLIRHHDTRLFHRFGTNKVLRDHREAERPLQPLRKLELPDKLEVEQAAHPGLRPASPSPSSPEWAATMPSLRSASVPDEQQAAEMLAKMPPKSESIEEMLL